MGASCFKNVLEHNALNVLIFCYSVLLFMLLLKPFSLSRCFSLSFFSVSFFSVSVSFAFLSLELHDDPVIERHTNNLYQALLEQNIFKVLEPYSVWARCCIYFSVYFPPIVFIFRIIFWPPWIAYRPTAFLFFVSPFFYAFYYIFWSPEDFLFFPWIFFLFFCL